jgi:hypothetical protein
MSTPFAPVDPRQSFPALEHKILDFWKRQDIFKKSLQLNEGGPLFVFFEGPPTANGRPGIHHVLARAFKDVIPRYKTMRGYRVPRRAGWDTHGLPVEIEVQNDKDAPLLAWSFVRATIEAAAEQQGLALPASVRRPGAQNEVIVVKDGKLHITALERASFADGSWFVSEGLSPTDAVVLAPDADAREGDPAPLLVEVK